MTSSQFRSHRKGERKGGCTLVKRWNPILTEVLTAGQSPKKFSASLRLCGSFLTAVLMTILLAVVLFGMGTVVQAETADNAKIVAGLEQELAAHVRLLSDWGGLTRYGSENAELGSSAPGVDRVVFLGDEITEMWGRGNAKFFPGKPFLNRGISHQTTQIGRAHV